MTFFFIYLSIKFVIIESVIKSETLTPSNANNINGISIILSSFEVNTNLNNEWNVTIHSQNTWQFLINLDKTWGFDPHNKSIINLTLNSRSPVNDLVFGFTVDNTQFFSVWLPMNNDGRKNRIHPKCDASNKPTATFSDGNISSLPDQERICDIAPGNDDYGCLYSTMEPKNAQNPKVFEYNGFPITLTLINNPMDNTFFMLYESALFHTGFTQKCGFVAMSAEHGLRVYIGGNKIGDTFTISSFDIEYIVTVPDVIDTKLSTTTKTTTTQISTTLMPSESPTETPSIAMMGDIMHSNDANREYVVIAFVILIVIIVIIICAIWMNDIYMKRYHINNTMNVELNTWNDSLSSLSEDAEDERDTEQDVMMHHEYRQSVEIPQFNDDDSLPDLRNMIH